MRWSCFGSWRRRRPCPRPAELDAARARLVAAITTDPATYATAVARGHRGPAQPVRRPAGRAAAASAPAPVLTAVKFMYGGAVSTAALLIAALPFIGDIHGTVLGHRLTPTPLTITLAIARRPGPDRPVAVDGAGDQPGQELGAHLVHGAVRPGDAGAAVGAGAIGKDGVAQVFFAGLTWLTGLAAVWLLWRPASSAFFKSARALRSRPPSQISGP